MRATASEITAVVTEVVIGPSGEARCLYGEAFDVACLGEVRVRRAGHCEPDERGRWWADLSPAGGPRLGPFDKRSVALGAEVSWLRLHAFPEPKS